MKKTLAIILILSFITAVFCSCNYDDPVDLKANYTPQLSDPIESYDNESRVVVNNSTATDDNTDSNEPNSYEENQTESGGFLIKDKKYDYGNNNVVLLNVTNETNVNYTVMIKMTYYSKDGHELKTETQTYQDIAADYNTYFVFQPYIAFETYKYQLIAKEYSGVCYLSNIQPGDWKLDSAIFSVWNSPVIELAHQGDDSFYNILYTKYQCQNNNDTLLYVRTCVVSFDALGNITYINIMGDKDIQVNEIQARDAIIHYQLDEMNTDKNTWPENLQGEIEILVIPIRALTEEQFQNLSY